MPEHSSRASFWTYPSQRGWVSQTAGLRGWSNVYRLRGVSSKTGIDRVVVNVVEKPDCKT